MSKVIVTGAGGFIGSHLTELLVKKGLEVKAFVHYNSKNDWGWLEFSDVKNEIDIISGDIRDYDSVNYALRDCHAVFHLAALIGIPYSYVSPKAYIETNIIGTYNILQATKELRLEQALITSTSETYGTAQYVPIDEKHPYVAQSPYAASKISADQLATSFYRSFSLPVKIVRPFNTYGPRQSARAFIPSVISQVLAEKKKIRLGNLIPSRDLTFVSDTCKGFYEIYEAQNLVGETTNVGMGNEISMMKLVTKILSIMNAKIEIELDQERVRPLHSEVERLVCNNKKLISNTSWEPDYNIDKGLLETIVWMQKNQSIYKHLIYNI